MTTLTIQIKGFDLPEGVYAATLYNLVGEAPDLYNDQYVNSRTIDNDLHDFTFEPNQYFVITGAPTPPPPEG